MLPLNAKQIPALFQQARAAQAKGDMAGAVKTYNTILSANPNLAEVHFNLAQIAAGSGEVAKAYSSIERAVKIKPTEPAIWSLWIDIAKGTSDTSELAKINTALPRSGIANPQLTQLSNRLNGKAGTLEDLQALMSSNKYSEAETLAAKLHKSHPKQAVYASILGAALAAEGKHDVAEKAFRTAMRAEKRSPEAHTQYATFLMSVGRSDEAVEMMTKAVHLAPKSPALRQQLGWLCYRAGAYAKAKLAFEKAAGLGLDATLLWVGRGQVALALKDDAAVGHFEHALSRGPVTPLLHFYRASALRAARRDDEALEAYDTALKLDPGAPALLADKAGLLQNLGRLDEARAALALALEKEPENGSLYLLYVSTGKLAVDDPISKKARGLFETNTTDRHLAFAVAKLAETAKDNPFPFLDCANKLSRDAFGYDFQMDAQAATVVRKNFEQRNQTAWQRAAIEAAPIFVTGMPRSGTTLVEQIIAAHSHVSGAGEVGVLGKLLGDVRKPPEPNVIQNSYWDMLQRRFPGGSRITDKSIATYVHIGFIKELMPKAKIVVVSRDPRDNALSIYKNMFADGLHRYSNDLKDIARFMRMFEAQIAYWDDAAPGSFTTISYEELIADPETQSRRLIADVGLDWEEACLDFHQSKARVDTLSNVQVRQPIYASSVGAWRSYESELAPFIETYGPIR